MRCFMVLGYLGAPFHGWQVQPGAVTVQGVLEEKLSMLLRTPIGVTGAGRTDAGVNARTMVAHFDYPWEGGTPSCPPKDCPHSEDIKTGGTGAVRVALTIPPPKVDMAQLVRRLNSVVGPAIAIDRIVEVAADAHARFDATSRTYHYYINHRKSPFFTDLSWYMPNALDYEAMNSAAAELLGVSDFTSFAKLHSDARTNICHVTEARWDEIAPGYWRFTITADRFLRNMVRAVVGTLVEVGRGKLTLDGFKGVIEARDRCAAGTSVPGEALYLWDVKYPYPI